MNLPNGLKVNKESDDVDLDRPVTFVQSTPDPERMMVKIARVSNQSNEDNWETGPKLLRYCLRKKHWSVFEHAFLTVRIETELDIAAQICRHGKGFSYSQFSYRYAKTQKPKVPEFRRQDKKNRQNSIDDLHPEVLASCLETSQAVIDQAFNVYERMLERSVALETARRILPVCSPTTIYQSGTLRNFIHYVEVRTDPSTQLEHRLIAEEIKKILIWKFPITAQALEWIPESE
jgi:thymidylate synthase (FAD)